jgi:pantoate--beta-alanine ligase
MTGIIHSVAELRGLVAAWKAQGLIVGLVPTMGALHAGHLSLVHAARCGADRVIVSIFVNPRQFNNAKDLETYPRNLGADVALVAGSGADLIFAPDPDEVYPAGFASQVSVSGVSAPLEGAHRPGHFDGMATVVAKLFGMSQADRAWFGQKDWQQLQIVQRMVQDLNINVEVIGAETIRDDDGLALSSRNARLSDEARAIAPSLYWAMVAAAADIRDGEPVDEVLDEAREAVLGAGFARIDYLELCSADRLEPLKRYQGPVKTPARLLAAAWLEDVRLIDNIAV